MGSKRIQKSEFKAKMGADPKLIEAIITAAKMGGGQKCAQPDCSRDSNGGCHHEGCLLSSYDSEVYDG